MFAEFSEFRHISRKGPHKQTIETTAAQPPSGGWATVVSVVWLWGLPGKHAGNRKTLKKSEISDFRANPRNLSGPDTTAVSILLLRAQNGREFRFLDFRRFKNDRIAFGTLKVHYYC